MTFGIGVVAPHYAGVVTDRLLSGDITVDGSDKCGSVRFRDGLFAYTYAGLAEVPTQNFQTREQLAAALCEAARPPAEGTPAHGVRASLEKVAQQLTRKMASLRIHHRQRATSILVAGFRTTEKGEQVGELHLVSNYERITGGNLPEIQRTFTVTSLVPRGVAISWVGSADVRQSTRTRALDLLEDSLTIPPWELEKILVAEVRAAATDDPQSIGRSCSSVFVGRDESEALVNYHVEHPTNNFPYTATVVAEYGNAGAYVHLDQHLSDVENDGRSVATRVPVVHKRQRCPCGSGRQYKNCHGNRRNVPEASALRVNGRFAVFAMPDDGSELTVLPTGMLN